VAAESRGVEYLAATGQSAAGCRGGGVPEPARGGVPASVSAVPTAGGVPSAAPGARGRGRSARKRSLRTGGVVCGRSAQLQAECAAGVPPPAGVPSAAPGEARRRSACERGLRAECPGCGRNAADPSVEPPRSPGAECLQAECPQLRAGCLRGAESRGVPSGKPPEPGGGVPASGLCGRSACRRGRSAAGAAEGAAPRGRLRAAESAGAGGVHTLAGGVATRGRSAAEGTAARGGVPAAELRGRSAKGADQSFWRGTTPPAGGECLQGGAECLQRGGGVPARAECLQTRGAECNESGVPRNRGGRSAREGVPAGVPGGTGSDSGGRLDSEVSSGESSHFAL
jgi:hypothetical protein